MAKQRIFHVIINGETKAIKYAYNTARREIPKILRTMIQTGESLELFKENREGGSGTYTGCVMWWQNEKTGAVIVAEVRKVE